MSELRSVVLGVGAYLPQRVLTNAQLSTMVDTSDAWIVERTGIRERRIAADGETTADLARHAAEAALKRAGLRAQDIDLIVLATATPNRTFPATAVSVQRLLGADHAAAFDVQAVCSGFVYALATADALLKVGQARRALVIGAETFSRILDWADRTTCVLFGDGAGALVLEAQAIAEAGDRGVLRSFLRSDGRCEDLLYVDGGPSSTQSVGKLRMQGNQVFRHAVTHISDAIVQVLEPTPYEIADVDWFVPHQANQRILDAVARRLDIPLDRIISTVGEHGNTSAASIPLALNRLVAEGRAKAGDLVLIEALGGGLTWGASLFRL
ncbi:MAG: beta-ketoacyl-ACP synthase III [Maricaulaceae bacterium]